MGVKEIKADEPYILDEYQRAAELLESGAYEPIYPADAQNGEIIFRLNPNLSLEEDAPEHIRLTPSMVDELRLGRSRPEVAHTLGLDSRFTVNRVFQSKPIPKWSDEFEPAKVPTA